MSAFVARDASLPVMLLRVVIAVLKKLKSQASNLHFSLFWSDRVCSETVFGPPLRCLPWPSFETRSDELMQVSLWIQLSRAHTKIKNPDQTTKLPA